MTERDQSEETHDVIVVGSGAGGMAAALTAAHHGLDVLVIEKSDYIGGSTAVSGGAVWIPGNPLMKDVGQSDSREDAIAYLRAILGNRFRQDLVEAFLDAGPKMVDFFMQNTAVKFAPREVSPDYQPGQPGAAGGGRTIDPVIYDGRKLGPDFKLLRPPISEFLAFGGMMVGRKDIDTLLGTLKSPKNFWGTTKLLARYAMDRLSHARGTRLLMGNALAASLLESARAKNIAVATQTGAVELIEESGRVTGLVAETKGQRRRLRARKGVVLATGGFPGSAAMRARLIPHADQHYSMAPAGNQGDGMAIASARGATIGDDNISNAFWAPVSVMTTKDGKEIRFPHLIMDRQKPGLVAVDQTGRRFVNEATSYHEFVEAMHKAHETRPTIPAFLICDARFIWRYGLGLVRPGPRSYAPFIKAGYLVKAGSVAELAARLQVDAGTLTKTLADMNAFAETGIDTQFGKGSNAYNRYLGDPDHRPNPCLGPIKTAPFYAVKVFPGDIGTAAGLRTDTRARVLDQQSQPITGLYAVGNDMNSIMAGAYPAAGITLGPALTFGYIAGEDLAAR